MSLHSRRKLKPKDAHRFEKVGPPLFAELAQVICRTGILPQKELHECWQMAQVVHRSFPDVLHIADIAAGHGLLAWILVLLARVQDKPIARTAVAVDITRPPSADILAAALASHWPELKDTVHYVEGSIDAVIAEDGPGTLLVAAHACGSLSDRLIMAAMASGSPIAIMPCCHSLRKQSGTLSNLAAVSGLSCEEIASSPASIDQFRIDALAACGYRISEDSIQREITAFNRIIMGQPSAETRTLAMGQTSADARALAPPISKMPMKRLGEIRAFEKVRSLNVADVEQARALSQRPSREWLRSFDLSFWVDDDAMGQSLGADLEARAPTAAITLHDRYIDPLTQRLAFTWRIEMKSSTDAITKADALLLRKNICLALAHQYTLRGEA